MRDRLVAGAKLRDKLPPNETGTDMPALAQNGSDSTPGRTLRTGNTAHRLPARDPYLDNAKGVLIILVVLGHMVWPLPAPERLSQAVYDFVYLFHVPLFAVISGYLSRDTLDLRDLAKNAAYLLLPYAVFQAIHSLLLRGYGLPFEPLNGMYGLWFLLSLFWWRLLLPAFTRIPFYFFLSVGIALACGYAEWICLPLSGSRTLVFFPYFLSGFLVRRRGADLRRLGGKPFVLVTIASLAVLCWLAADVKGAHVLLWNAYSYTQLNLPFVYGPVVRLLLLAIGFAACFSVLALIPARPSMLTRTGANSLNVFLLHSPLLIAYRQHPAVYEFINCRSLILILPVASAVALGLGSETAARLFRPLTRPIRL